VATKKNGMAQQNFSLSSFGAVVGSGMDKNQIRDLGINIPDPQH
jgi:hypothetical protein